MSLQVVQRGLVESIGMFSIGAMGGSMAKSVDEPWLKMASVVGSAALEVMYIFPRISEYVDRLPQMGWRQRVVSLGETFVLPAVSLGAGIYFGATTGFDMLYGRL